jgi:hypothetical protein
MAMRDEKITAPPQEVPVGDLHLASYVLALGYSLVRIEGPPHRIIFIFSNVSEQLIISFFREDATVNPRKLLDALRNLRGLLLQRDRGQR